MNENETIIFESIDDETHNCESNECNEDNIAESAETIAANETGSSQKLIDLFIASPKLAQFFGCVIDGEEPDTAARRLFAPPSTEMNHEMLNEKLQSLSVPKDELETMARKVNEVYTSNDSSLLLDLLVKGCYYENALKCCEEQAYIKGRNEKIEIEKRNTYPIVKDEGASQPFRYEEILKTQRRSIWDD